MTSHLSSQIIVLLDIAWEFFNWQKYWRSSLQQFDLKLVNISTLFFLRLDKHFHSNIAQRHLKREKKLIYCSQSCHHKATTKAEYHVDTTIVQHFIACSSPRQLARIDDIGYGKRDLRQSRSEKREWR